MLNEGYKDMLQALSDEEVRFLLVGAYALAACSQLDVLWARLAADIPVLAAYKRWLDNG